MRTNIDIRDDLMARAMIATGKHTKRETVEAALEIAVRLKDQEGLRDLFGTVNWVGDLDAMRRLQFLDLARAGGLERRRRHRSEQLDDMLLKLSFDRKLS